MPKADIFDRLNDENIAAALKGFYTPPKPTRGTIPCDQLIQLLETLPALSVEDHVDPMLVQIQKHHRGTLLSVEQHALLSFIDDAMTQLLGQTDLDFKIESFLRDLAPLIAVIALKKGVLAITREQPILHLMDTLVKEALGWSEDLGVLGEQFIQKIETTVRSMVTGRMSLDECQTTLNQLFDKDRPIFMKMETRLINLEMHRIASQRARFYAAELLNQQMANKKLPLFIIFMLQGSWFEFLKNIFSTCGEKSREWDTARKITEAFIWALQPQNNREKLNRVMDSLPGHIRELSESTGFETADIESCIQDIIGEFDAIRAESPSDPCDFELITVDGTLNHLSGLEDAAVKSQIRVIAPGGWYLFDDPDEPEEKIARLKLLLNWEESGRLLFTNHNRRKVLQMGYAEFAEHLETDRIKVLTPKMKAWETIKQHVLHVVEGVREQKKKETTAAEATEKKALTQAYIDRRKFEIVQAVKQHRLIAKLKQKRAMVLRQKAQQKLDAAANAIASLKTDAWLKLPVMEGTLTPCRLVAIIPANDNYIFANRAGLKVGEFTRSQLIHSLITENSEILDTGAEFESVLSSVVSTLRDNRNKSYDELTGTH